MVTGLVRRSGRDEVSYRANRFSGWALVIAGIAALLHNTFFLHAHADWSSPALQLFVTLSTAFLLFLGLIVSANYVRRL